MRIPLLALLFGATTPIAAQYKPIIPSPSRLFVVGTGTVIPDQSTDTLPKVGDHRMTGAAIGGIIGGVAGFTLGRLMDESGGHPDCGGCVEDEPRSDIYGAAIGAFVGAGFGYLMGRSTPKGSYPDAPPPAPLPRDTGLSPKQGAGIGAAIGAVAFTFLALQDDSGDGEPVVIIAAPLGALVGAFVGYGVTRE
jgi:hypothetical protein